MAKVHKKRDTLKWISFDQNQANLSEVKAVASTIKGARIEEKHGVTRIYIPRQTPPPASFRISKVLREGKLASVKGQKVQSKEQHYCAIMFK